MSRTRKILMGLVIVLVILQFFKPSKNEGQLVGDNDISKKYAISEEVHQILIKKCYDCHSNSTIYPWYYNIQPVGMWMAHHVNEGKEELNFAEFKTYTERRANHKLESLHDAVTEGWMPLDSYLWIHKEAKITSQDAALINEWIDGLGIKFEEHNHKD